MLEEIVPMIPVHFFAFLLECLYVDKELTKKHRLPDLTSFHGEFSFAEVYLGWHETGIFCEVHVRGIFDEPEFPDVQKGDCIELFMDTRDVKTTAHNTRFCHHFVFFPAPFLENGEEIHAKEITRFRGEDMHMLCDPNKLILNVSSKRKMKILKIFIPRECLSGYDTAQFDRIGFSYRINRKGETAQYFSANDADFTVETQPSFWASFNLVKTKNI